MNFLDFKNTVKYDHYRSIDKQTPIYIFGAGNFARDIGQILINQGYKVWGFIVSRKNSSSLLDRPILEWHESRTSNATIVVGTFSHNVSYNQILKEIELNGYANPVMPWELYDQFSNELGWRYWLANKNYYIENLSNIEKAYELYQDQESKSCLLNALLFRCGLNPTYADFTSDEKHYFNKLSLDRFGNKAIALVDGGAFTGDTFQLAKNSANIGTALLFEPDPDNYNKLKKNVKNKAVCYPLALSNASKIVKFNSSVGPSSSITDIGDSSVHCVSLDSFLTNIAIDFIKLDIEGSESAALHGAKNCIEKFRPVIVMAGYHKPGDLWNLLFDLKIICQNYKFYLRQHDYNSFETVIYAIPN